MLRFRTSTEKKIQAIAVLLREEGGQADCLRLLKILYIADREALKERGSPIVGGRIVAVNSGPLHSEVDEMIKGEHECDAVWSAYFVNDGNKVVLSKDPGRLELSPFEIEKLVEVSHRFRLIDAWALAEHTHAFGEYAACYQADTTQTIPLERLLAELGFEPDEIREIQRNAESDLRLTTLIGDSSCPSEAASKTPSRIGGAT